jgi:hypothetical protein
MTPVFDVDPEDEDGKVTLPPSRRQPDRPLEGEEAAAHIAGLVPGGTVGDDVPEDGIDVDVDIESAAEQLAEDMELIGRAAQEPAPPVEGQTRYLVQRFHSATMLDGEMFEVWIDLGTLDAPSRDEALATLRSEAWARFMPGAGATTAFRIVAERALGRTLPVEGRAMVVPIWGGETP